MLKILVVDNDFGLIQLLQLVFESRGFAVTVAMSGDEALEKLEEQLPDVVLLDLMTPEGEGIEVCRRIRANPDTANLPIVFLSAKSSPQTRFLAMRAGADEYLVKPIRPSDLVERLIQAAVEPKSPAGVTV